MTEPARVAVIGAGYVGLTTGACLADMGHRVVCADIDEGRVARLRSGQVPFHEPGLPQMVRRGLDSGRLSFVVNSAPAAAGADFVFLCLPTPSRPDGSADTSKLLAVAAEIGPHLKPGAVAVTKSTVPVGNSQVLHEALGRTDAMVVSNPEFLREGTAIDDFMRPDRVIVGATDETSAAKVVALYEPLSVPVLVTDPGSAELIKYATNAFLATKLSFVNAVAAICEEVGADIDAVLKGMGADPRVGTNFMQPGPGWGGSCLPKDSRALVTLAAGVGYDFSLLRGAIAQNDDQFDRVVSKVADRVALDGARIGLLGLAFKAGTDDTRASPALEIARRMIAAGAEVRAYDPVVTAVDMAGVTVEPDPYDACRGAVAVVVATEWPELADLDPARMAEVMAELHVIDARGILARDAWRSRGFTYQASGRS